MRLVFIEMTQALSNILLFLASDTDFLAFMELVTAGGVVKKSLPPAYDAISTDIEIPFGFAFGNTSQPTVYVSIHDNMVVLVTILYP